jgi:hypothetical protein
VYVCMYMDRYMGVRGAAALATVGVGVGGGAAGVGHQALVLAGLPAPLPLQRLVHAARALQVLVRSNEAQLLGRACTPATWPPPHNMASVGACARLSPLPLCVCVRVRVLHIETAGCVRLSAT